MLTKAQKTTAVVASVALLLGAWAFAASDQAYGRPNAGPGRMTHRPPGPGVHMRLGQILRRLDLTEEQIEQIKPTMESARENAQASRDTMNQARGALAEAVTKGADEETIRAAATNLGNVIGNEAVKKSSTMASVRGLLTEQQLTELDKLLAERKERREEFGKGGRGPGRHTGMRDRRGGPGQRHGRQGGRGPGQGNRGPGRGEGPNIDRLFDRLDADEDGTLSREELEGFSQGRRNRPGRNW